MQTDVFDLAIDPLGGDIVQLKLPLFPRRQDRPDVPFQLFDNGGERTYLAQSGLIGVLLHQRANSKIAHRAQTAYWSASEAKNALGCTKASLVCPRSSVLTRTVREPFSWVWIN